MELSVGTTVADGTSGELSERSGGASLAIEEGDNRSAREGEQVSVGLVSIVDHVLDLEAVL